MQLCCSLGILWHCLSLGLEWKIPEKSVLIRSHLPWPLLSWGLYLHIISKDSNPLFLLHPCFYLLCVWHDKKNKKNLKVLKCLNMRDLPPKSQFCNSLERWGVGHPSSILVSGLVVAGPSDGARLLHLLHECRPPSPLGFLFCDPHLGKSFLDRTESSHLLANSETHHEISCLCAFLHTVPSSALPPKCPLMQPLQSRTHFLQSSSNAIFTSFPRRKQGRDGEDRPSFPEHNPESSFIVFIQVLFPRS